MKSCEDCGQSQEAVRVKDEPEPLPSPGDCYLATPIKEETDNAWHSECLDETEHVKQEASLVESVQQQPSCSAAAGARGVSAAAALAGLYTDHTVKDELVLGPEVLHRPNVTPVCCGTMPADRDSGQQPHLALKDCTVRLERIPYNTLLARTDTTSKMEDIDCIYNTDSEISYSVDIKTLSDNESIEEGMHTGYDSELPCYVCSKRFTHKSDLMKHVAIHIYNPSSELDGNVIHSDTEVDNEVHACDICGKIFGLKLKLMEHVVSHIYVQEDCEVNGEERDIQQDYVDDGDEKPDIQPEHVDGDPGRDSGSAHVLQPLEPAVSARGREQLALGCSVRLERLRDHQLKESILSGRKTYSCEECGSFFRSKTVLRRHIRLSHVSSETGYDQIQKKHACDFCSSTFQTKLVLLEHEKNEHGVTSYMCSECEYSTVYKKTLQKHLKSHVVQTRFKSIHCSYGSLTLKSHLKTNLIQKSFECSDAYFESKFQNNLQRHREIHTSSRAKPFQCSYCDYKCSRKDTLQVHLRTHTGEKPFQCSYCDYKSIRKQFLQAHLRTHSGSKPFHCSYCDYKSAWKNNLQAHLRTHTGEKPFQCSYCDYKSAWKNTLQHHLRAHTGSGFQCSYCNYKCSRKDTLQVHLRTHTGEKPFQCSYCDYKSIRKHDLQAHLRTHSGSKPFHCSYCDYKSAWKNNLQAHLRTHTGEKPFQCSYCDYKSAWKNTLQHHLRTHTGEKLFQCSYCDYKCTRKSYLQVHLRTHTG